MVSLDAVYNGLNRALSFLQDRLNSKASIYAKTVDHITEIRKLAEEVVLLCDSLLSKADIEQPIEPVRAYDTFEDLEPIEVDMAQLSVSQAKPEPICVEPQTISKSDVVHQEASNLAIPTVKVPRGFVKKFKSILKSTAKTVVVSEDSWVLSQLSLKIAECFELRFDPKYDPAKIHKFRVSEFRNYLVSYIIAFAQCADDGDVSEYFQELENWLGQVRSGTCKYTLPQIVSNVYFGVIYRNEDSSVELSETAVENAEGIWQILWSSGYNKFFDLLENPAYDDVVDDILPTPSMSWVGEQLQASIHRGI